MADTNEYGQSMAEGMNAAMAVPTVAYDDSSDNSDDDHAMEYNDTKDTAAENHPSDGDGDVPRAAATTAPTEENARPKKRKIQEEKRAQICLFLAQRVDHSRGKLQRGAMEEAAVRYGVSTKGTVAGLWYKHKNFILYPDKYTLDVRRKKGSGRSTKWTHAEIMEAVKKVPCRYRNSLRALSDKVGIPRTTLHRFLKAQDEIFLTSSSRGAAGSGDSAAKRYANDPGVDKLRDENEEDRLADARAFELREQLRERYEREKAVAVTAAKAEAKRRHDAYVQRIMSQQRILRREGQFEEEKERVIYQLRVEMHRHQMELNRLKGDLDRLNGGSKSDNGDGENDGSQDDGEAKEEEMNRKEETREERSGEEEESETGVEY
eukprot:CAMPEP_0183718978 /NCGR_PEP_ID=MMETSP0737-20130205/12084_1 /TAXON_ID=385413 /ORGANISM="Thalassiosira miniscula, Strain CCMP1093" /LENGTH=376 /DNA_ID=CAMNT_0025948639 /DNA_START=6 /DNA_END=1136 /DNA_ORIENTATION=-